MSGWAASLWQALARGSRLIGSSLLKCEIRRKVNQLQRVLGTLIPGDRSALVHHRFQEVGDLLARPQRRFDEIASHCLAVLDRFRLGRFGDSSDRSERTNKIGAGFP